MGRGLLMLQAQAQPVALALLGVMVLGLAAVLQGYAILWPFLAGASVAYLVAALYGQNALHQTPAELVVDGPRASVRSVWDAAAPPAHTDLEPVISTRLEHGEFHVGMGDTIRTFRRDEWPEFDDVVSALRGASHLANTLGTAMPSDA